MEFTNLRNIRFAQSTHPVRQTFSTSFNGNGSPTSLSKEVASVGRYIWGRKRRSSVGVIWRFTFADESTGLN